MKRMYTAGKSSRRTYILKNNTITTVITVKPHRAPVSHPNILIGIDNQPTLFVRAQKRQVMNSYTAVGAIGIYKLDSDLQKDKEFRLKFVHLLDDDGVFGIYNNKFNVVFGGLVIAVDRTYNKQIESFLQSDLQVSL